jgi:hypothetical protein
VCDLVMYSLTCNKLSHCLYDFDCLNFDNEYKNEKYEFNKFIMRELKCGDGDLSKWMSLNEDTSLNATEYDCKFLLTF